MSVTGEEGGRPLRSGAAVVDLICGLSATIGILGALTARATTSASTGAAAGQHVDVTLMDAALLALLNQGSGFLGAGVVPGRLGNRHPTVAPYATYEASDGTFVLAVGNDTLWQKLRVALDLPDDERFATNGSRREHLDALDSLLNPRFAAMTRSDVVTMLRGAGVPAGPVNDVAEAFAFATELGLEPTVSVDGRDLLRPPVRLSATPASVRRAPPALDADGDAVRAWLRADRTGRAPL